jgi:hypothetical protein
MGPAIRSLALSLTLTLAVASLAGCTAPPPQPDPLVGAWRAKVTARSGALTAIPDLVFMTVFNVGGTMTESSNYDSAPPAPPAYGVWRKTGERTFQARYDYWVAKPPAGFDELAKGGGWTPDGYGTLEETITVSADGRSYVSTLTYGFVDAAGKPGEGGGTATVQAVKMGF